MALKSQIKLGDKIVNANVNKSGIVINGVAKNYRVIGLNPVVKLVYVFYKNGFEELGEEITIDENIVAILKPMFDENHPFRNLHGMVMDHSWIGNWKNI